MSDTTTKNNKPAYNIFTRVPNGEGKTKAGNQIGVAFKFTYSEGAGEGLNLVLDSQPIPRNGKIELVAYPPKSK